MAFTVSYFYQLLVDSIVSLLFQVFNHLFSPVSRENALSVFSYMMLLYKHSPEIFHLVRHYYIDLKSVSNQVSPKICSNSKVLCKTLPLLLFAGIGR